MSLTLRNRITELRQMRPADLAVHAHNFRRHPTAQAAALKGLLTEVGIAEALLAYPSAQGGGTLTLIDGEERRETAPMEPWPTLILDADNAGADLLPASLELLAAIVEADAEVLHKLLAKLTHP